MSPIKVAMAYSSASSSLNGSGRNKIAYYFFSHAVFRNKNLEVDYLDTLDKIDISKLKNDYDVILLPEVTFAAVLSLAGIKDCNIPVIAKAHDPHAILKRDTKGWADSLKVDWFFDFYAPESFYEYYPRHLKYAVVHTGLEPSLCDSEIPWNERIQDRIGISGILDERFDLIHKIYYRVYLRKPKALLPGFHYKLRTKCSKLPYVAHARDIYPGHSTDQLHGILSRFRATIAATTSFPTVKYKETPAAGCLTFMEITERNHGSFLGFEDGKSAIFIDESNYLERFQEYLDSPDDPRWKKIAQAGRRHALENLSNDMGVEMLVSVMRRALGEEDAQV